jgi:amino-acid N-acetyltransferase
MIHYVKASLSDIPAMQELVRPQVIEGIILDRNNDEIATNIRSYILAYEEKKLVGFTALHIHTINLAEIRSLIVDADYQNKKIGTTLVQKALEEAKKLGLGEILVLTYRKNFFEQLGFVEIPKESIPVHKIWADCVKCKHFPVCNEISLIKTV